MKKIYDKHKNIWWAWANVGEQMTKDDFLWFQRYHLFWLEAQEGHLVLTHKPSAFHSIMGLCSS
jgi:hypothetical protein